MYPPIEMASLFFAPLSPRMIPSPVDDVLLDEATEQFYPNPNPNPDANPNSPLNLNLTLN